MSTHQKLLTEFSKRIGYPLFWRTRGLKVKNRLAKLQASQWLPSEELESIQWRRLKRLLQHSYENVPYYRKVFDNLDITPEDITDLNSFRKLPFLSKSDIRSNFASLISTNMNRKIMRMDSTGGSTGENISFLEDRLELSYRFANTLRGDSMAGLVPGTRFIELWGAPFDAPGLGFIGSRLSRMAFRRVFLSAFNLSEEQMLSYVKTIKSFNPQVILGYSSPLYHFAKFMTLRGIQLKSVNSIISTAETLSEHQRELVESAFRCKVFNRYGCREFGNLGTECSVHSGIHIFTDKFVIETLRNGLPVAQGDVGELVVTDLHKYGMPLIRYRIGDLGVPSDLSCSCGRGLPIIARIEGRTFDIVTGLNGQYVAGNFFSFLSRSVPGIRQFQVVQEDLDRIVMFIVRDDAFLTDCLKELEIRIINQCGIGTTVSFKFLDNIPLTKSGKHRIIISKVPVKFN